MKTTSKMKTTLRLYIDEAHTALNIFPCASNTTFVVLVVLRVVVLVFVIVIIVVVTVIVNPW